MIQNYLTIIYTLVTIKQLQTQALPAIISIHSHHVKIKSTRIAGQQSNYQTEILYLHLMEQTCQYQILRSPQKVFRHIYFHKFKTTCIHRKILRRWKNSTIYTKQMHHPQRHNKIKKDKEPY